MQVVGCDELMQCFYGSWQHTEQNCFLVNKKELIQYLVASGNDGFQAGMVSHSR
jgi:hypothetical protein